jgi:hypothetical protein
MAVYLVEFDTIRFTPGAIKEQKNDRQGGRLRLHHDRIELQPVFPVRDPTSLRDQPLPSGHKRQRPHDRRLLSMPFCLDAKHAETAVVVVEGDALDDAGDLLGRGSALWHGGVHVGINFATDGWGMGDPPGADLRGFGSRDRFRSPERSEALAAFVATLASAPYQY